MRDESNKIKSLGQTYFIRWYSQQRKPNLNSSSPAIYNLDIAQQWRRGRISLLYIGGAAEKEKIILGRERAHRGVSTFTCRPVQSHISIAGHAGHQRRYHKTQEWKCKWVPFALSLDETLYLVALDGGSALMLISIYIYIYICSKHC